MSTRTLSSFLSKLTAALIIIILVLAAMPVKPAYAANYTVNTNADNTTNDAFCTLREAILAANNAPANANCGPGSAVADTITFAANYTITLGSQLPAVTTQITITGNGAANTIIQANANPNTATYRVFEVTATGNLTITGLTVRNGRCNGSCATSTLDGGGIYNNGGILNVTNSTISGNTASGSGNGGGGGIFNTNSGTVNVTNSTISGNTATGGRGGGGIGGRGGNIILNVTNSTISGNTAGVNGGGIYNYSANAACGGTVAATVTNSTLSGNTATGVGGGIYNHNGLMSITSSTIVSNTAAANAGGGVRSDNDNITCTRVGSSIIAGNTGSDVSATATNQRFSSLGYNVIGTAGSNVNFALEFNQVQDVTNVANPQVGALANNGGPTQTRALLTGSPAINRGSAACPATDQRGVARPQGAACDSGAYELGLRTVTYAHNPAGGTGILPTQADVPIGGTFIVASGAGLTRAGYTFAGWNDGTTTYAAGATYTMGVNNVTLTAQWTPINYTVIYSAGLGSGPVPTDSTNYNIGNTVTVLFTPLPTRTGYTFAGWSDGTTTYTSGGTTSFTMGASNVTLTAQWTPNLLHAWTFNTGGSDSVGTATATLLNGANIVSCQLNLNGTSAYASLPIGADIAALNDTSIEAWVTWNNNGAWARIFDFGNNTTVNMFLTPYNGATSRYAITTSGGGGEQQVTAPSALATGVQKHVVVTINSATNTGTLYVDGVQVAQNIAMTLRPSSLGNTTNNWLGRSQYPADPYFSGLINEFRIYSGVLSPAQVLTNYNNPPAPCPPAIVTFNANFPYPAGGSGTMSNQSYTSGVAQALTANAFADTGYTFTGWNTAANGSGTAYTDGQSITIYADITLYAQWKDSLNPDVTIEQASGQVDPTNVSPILFTITFSEDIDATTFTAADLTLGGTVGGTLSASLTEVTPNRVYTISVSGMSSTGTVIVSLNANTVQDLAGNFNNASNSTDNTVTYDVNALTVTVEQAATQSDPTNVGPILFTVTFNKPINTTTFDATDITLGGTAPGTLIAILTEIAPNDGTTFEVSASGMSSNGTVTASIAANTVQDPAGNDNADSSSTDNEVTYDTTNPAVVSTDLDVTYTGTGPANFTVTFSKDVSVTGGATGPDSATNPANYLLVNKGVNGTSDTASCGPVPGVGGVKTDDTQVAVSGVTYDSATFTSTVTLLGSLPVGSYRLFVCGTTSIVDLVGNPLNGGTSDYTFDFVVNAAPARLPATGFPQGSVTVLPAQPASKAYAGTDMVLEIPSLNQKMTIVGVPQTEKSWDVTWLGNNAGWLEGSAYPTWNGNTVLTGHVWDSFNRPGPFANLKNLKYGDQILIHAFGMTYTYEVRENKTYWAKTAVSKVFQHEELDWVTLVTCETYNPVNGDYFFRRAVRAVLISVK